MTAEERKEMDFQAWEVAREKQHFMIPDTYLIERLQWDHLVHEMSDPLTREGHFSRRSALGKIMVDSGETWHDEEVWDAEGALHDSFWSGGDGTLPGGHKKILGGLVSCENLFLNFCERHDLCAYCCQKTSVRKYHHKALYCDDCKVLVKREVRRSQARKLRKDPVWVEKQRVASRDRRARALYAEKGIELREELRAAKQKLRYSEKACKDFSGQLKAAYHQGGKESQNKVRAKRKAARMQKKLRFTRPREVKPPIPGTEEYRRKKAERKKARKHIVQLILVQEGLCGICGKKLDGGPLPSLAVDHINPLVAGGSSEIANLQVVHSRCNSIKGQEA